MSGAVLEIERLSLAIHGHPVLHDVSFSLSPGKILGLVGESGSGKSMTALAAMQLLPEGARMTGTARVAGESVTELSEKALCGMRGRDIGMVFQEPMTALNPLKTIGDQVAETVRMHRGTGRREALEIARAVLNDVGLPEERFPLTRYPHELSGGQRQRVVIAMAIALRPKVLIADEPTTALDVTTQAQILDLLKRLVAEHEMGLVLITHDLAVVAGMADRIAIMQAGRIVEENDTLALFRTMSHPYTKKLLAAASHIPDRTAPPARDGGQPPLLAVSDIVREYRLPRTQLFGKARHFRAVDGVSFEIGRGENVALVGESGCGKSTLARAILGLDRVDGGRIAIDGSPFADESRFPDAAARRKVQAVFQDPYGSFNPRHKVERLVAEPLHLVSNAPTGAARRAHVEAMLAEVGLSPSDADKYVHEFSGGQRQRLAIARALIIEPSLVVLDEAVSALDVSIRARILDLLAKLSARLSVSYLFISHDLSVVRAIADRVLVMKSGQIVEAGPTEEIFANPGHAYTQALIAATPLIEPALERRATEAARQAASS